MHIKSRPPHGIPPQTHAHATFVNADSNHQPTRRLSYHRTHQARSSPDRSVAARRRPSPCCLSSAISAGLSLLSPSTRPELIDRPRSPWRLTVNDSRRPGASSRVKRCARGRHSCPTPTIVLNGYAAVSMLQVLWHVPSCALYLVL